MAYGNKNSTGFFDRPVGVSSSSSRPRLDWDVEFVESAKVPGGVEAGDDDMLERVMNKSGTSGRAANTVSWGDCDAKETGLEFLLTLFSRLSIWDHVNIHVKNMNLILFWCTA